MPAQTQHYGIDTSIFVRLLTGQPESDYEKTVAALKQIIAESPLSEIKVSNMVIAEAYIALQHHYGTSKADAKAGIATLLGSGLVQAMNGPEIVGMLGHSGGCGLIDRLIANDYRVSGLVTLSNDHRMAKLSDVRLLWS